MENTELERMKYKYAAAVMLLVIVISYLLNMDVISVIGWSYALIAVTFGFGLIFALLFLLGYQLMVMFEKSPLDAIKWVGVLVAMWMIGTAG